MNKLLDSIDRRLTRGHHTLTRHVPWDAIGLWIVLAFASPILIPWGVACWIVGFFHERGENKRNGVRSVR